LKTRGRTPIRVSHHVFKATSEIIATKKVNWISDADIKGFFDNVKHEQLVELLKVRISDPRMLWLIQRFLKSGVMIDVSAHYDHCWLWA
jgi:RNA-directed DNA polymerase